MRDFETCFQRGFLREIVNDYDHVAHWHVNLVAFNISKSLQHSYNRSNFDEISFASWRRIFLLFMRHIDEVNVNDYNISSRNRVFEVNDKRKNT